MKKIKSLLVVSVLLFSSLSKTEELKTFLLTCVYGAAAGAGVGLATVAFAENPSSKTSNIAKGASLGLYAGIAAGWYMNYAPVKNRNEVNNLYFDNLDKTKLTDKTSLKPEKNWMPYLIVQEEKKYEFGSILFF